MQELGLKGYADQDQRACRGRQGGILPRRPDSPVLSDDRPRALSRARSRCSVLPRVITAAARRDQEAPSITVARHVAGSVIGRCSGARYASPGLARVRPLPAPPETTELGRQCVVHLRERARLQRAQVGIHRERDAHLAGRRERHGVDGDLRGAEDT